VVGPHQLAAPRGAEGLAWRAFSYQEVEAMLAAAGVLEPAKSSS
jgi:hypothetical protein